MNSNDSNSPGVWTLTIKDFAPQGFLSFDVKDILPCLGPDVHRYSWIVTELDATGPETEALCRRVAECPAQGIVLSSDEFLSASQKIHQTLDGTFIGVPWQAYDPQELDVLVDLDRFPENTAEVVIRAVDSSWFEVMTKNPAHVAAIKARFRDVQEVAAARHSP
jgi:hypothetical protein